MASDKDKVTTPTLKRIRQRQRNARKKSKASVKKMKTLITDARKDLSREVTPATTLSQWISRGKLAYKGIKIGMQIASAIRTIWPKKK